MNLGKRYYSHRLYSLHRLDVGDIRTFDKTENLGSVQLIDGMTPRIALASDHGALNDLTLESAKKLFGEPTLLCESPRDSKDQLATFNLKALLDRDEPNIFHIDFEIEKGGKAKSYRVRGFENPEPSWQTLAAE
ncbi:MAG: hypothetical protein C0464_02255 [Cyanobacteria bacterium DS2.008]|nr:hypothetical protein [Cyanobacteria bacterium DS2.008]